MFELLHKYLVLYNHVNVPGVGHFTTERRPAKLNLEAGIIDAPTFVVKHKNETDSADKAFYNFIASELNIEVVDAIRKFQDFSYQLKNSISSGKIVELPSLGTLSMHRNEIKFDPDLFAQKYFPALDLNKAPLAATGFGTTKNDSGDFENQEVGEGKTAKSYWWLYAFILALIAIAAIVYYYQVLQNN